MRFLEQTFHNTYLEWRNKSDNDATNGSVE